MPPLLFIAYKSYLSISCSMPAINNNAQVIPHAYTTARFILLVVHDVIFLHTPYVNAATTYVLHRATYLRSAS